MATVGLAAQRLTSLPTDQSDQPETHIRQARTDLQWRQIDLSDPLQGSSSVSDGDRIEIESLLFGNRIVLLDGNEKGSYKDIGIRTHCLSKVVFGVPDGNPIPFAISRKLWNEVSSSIGTSRSV